MVPLTYEVQPLKEEVKAAERVALNLDNVAA